MRKVFAAVVLVLSVLVCVSCEMYSDYYVGGDGPLGGIIIYDKGRKTDGWRFLEIAKEDFSAYGIERWPMDRRVHVGNEMVMILGEEWDWLDGEKTTIEGKYYDSGFGEGHLTERSLGTGKRNCARIYSTLKKLGQYTTTLDSIYDTYGDEWYIPSFDEMRLALDLNDELGLALKMEWVDGPSGLLFNVGAEMYWTSSESTTMIWGSLDCGCYAMGMPTSTGIVSNGYCAEALLIRLFHQF